MAPLRPADVEQIAELHRRVFGVVQSGDGPLGFLADIFFRHPWLDDALPSLGFFDRGGRLLGCLGVMPRPMTFRDQPISVVVTHNFMVDREAGSGLAAIQLMRDLMRHAPDVVLADGNEATRRIGAVIGARVIPQRSQRWLRVLRPAGLGANLLGRRVPRAFASAVRAASALTDAIAARLPGSSAPEGSRVDMDGAALDESFHLHTRRFALRPTYTAGSATWLLDCLRRASWDEDLCARSVRVGDENVGWYLYYSRPNRVGRVLQIGAKAGSESLVLRHLFWDALKAGDVGVSGQSDPAWTRELKAARCVFRRRGSRVIAFARDPEIERTLGTRHAFLGRLEGEGWIHGRVGPRVHAEGQGGGAVRPGITGPR